MDHRNPDLTRTVMADGIWQAHQEKIAGYLARGARNRLDLLRIQDTAIRDIRLTPTDQQITVRFVVDSAEYVVNEAGAQISGTKKVSSWTEDWVFEREVAAIRDDAPGWVLARIDQVPSVYPSETRNP